MCEFPSWTEMTDGTILFLTDDDIAKLSPEAVEDCCGHSALHEIFPKNGGKDRESWPCPRVIATAIRAGKMRKMAEAGGVTNCEVDAKGYPTILAITRDSLDLRGCTGLKSIPAALKVNYLELRGCAGRKSIPAGLKVNSLYLRGCTGLKSIPAGLKVNSLDLRGCTGLKSIPAGLKVNYLDLRDCTGLKSIPAGLKVNYLDLPSHLKKPK